MSLPPLTLLAMSDPDSQPGLPATRPPGFVAEQLLLPLFPEGSDRAEALRSVVRLVKTQALLLTDDMGATDSLVVKLTRGTVATTTVATVVCTARGVATRRDELAEQERLLEAITQWVYALFSVTVGCGVYSETELFWSSFTAACGIYLALAALPRRPLP